MRHFSVDIDVSYGVYICYLGKDIDQWHIQERISRVLTKHEASDALDTHQRISGVVIYSL